MQIDRLRIDTDEAAEGRWFTLSFPEMGGGFEIKVRSAKSRAAKKWLLERHREKRDRLSQLDAEDYLEIGADMLIEYVVVDWRGLEDANGVAIPCDEHWRREILLSEQFEHISDRVAELANSFDAFAVRAEEREQGN